MFDKLKKLFVVEDGTTTPEQKAVNSVESDVASNEVPTMNEPQVTISANASEGVADQKFIDILLKAIESNNLNGFDYLEYKQALQSLANMPMDDATRYNSALAMAKTMGASKASILDSAKHYLKILQQEEGKFKNALGGQQAKVEQNQTVGISNLEKSIQHKQAQVETILKQIEEDKAKLEQMKQEITASANKIQTTANNFMSAYNLVAGQIVSDMDNIQKFVN